jgi:hypothetical protein
MVRLLLHGLSFRAADGEPVQVSSHVLRHYAASWTMPHVEVPAANHGHFGDAGAA